jgi:hypothetical protein
MGNGRTSRKFIPERRVENQPGTRALLSRGFIYFAKALSSSAPVAICRVQLSVPHPPRLPRALLAVGAHSPKRINSLE